MFVFPVSVSVHHHLAPICGGRPPLSQVQILSRVPCAKSVALSLKPFKDTQDVSMYERFLIADDLDND